jgi:hypothetical protein
MIDLALWYRHSSLYETRMRLHLFDEQLDLMQ